MSDEGQARSPPPDPNGLLVCQMTPHIPDSMAAEMIAVCQVRLMRRSRMTKNHLVGAGEQGRRHVEPEYLRSLEMVDHQVDLGGLVHRLVSWFVAYDNPAAVDANQPPCVAK